MSFRQNDQPRAIAFDTFVAWSSSGMVLPSYDRARARCCSDEPLPVDDFGPGLFERLGAALRARFTADSHPRKPGVIIGTRRRVDDEDVAERAA